MGWHYIGTRPKAESAGAYSKPFLVEYRKLATGESVVAVSRSYLTVRESYAGLQSIQRGLTYDSADADLRAVYEPVSWQPMPNGGMEYADAEGGE